MLRQRPFVTTVGTVAMVGSQGKGAKTQSSFSAVPLLPATSSSLPRLPLTCQGSTYKLRSGHMESSRSMPVSSTTIFGNSRPGVVDLATSPLSNHTPKEKRSMLVNGAVILTDESTTGRQRTRRRRRARYGGWKWNTKGLTQLVKRLLPLLPLLWQLIRALKCIGGSRPGGC